MSSTVERALELARSGNCKNMTELRNQLRHERYDDVAEHLSGSLMRKQLLEAIRISEKMASYKDSAMPDFRPAARRSI